MGLHDAAWLSSGPITGDVAVSAVPSVIGSIKLRAGSGASSLLIYDAASATGTILYRIDNVATDSATTVFEQFQWPGLIVPSTGIFVDWTGTAAIGYITYHPL